MATLDLSNATQPIDMTDPNLVGFDSWTVQSPSDWRFNTTGGHEVAVVGSGFTFDQNGRELTGTATAIEIDAGNNGFNNPDIMISGISVPAATLDDGAQSFWRVLEGNDVIIAPSEATAGTGSFFTLFGDGIEARAGASTGGNDVFSIGDTFANVFGDVLNVGSQTPGMPAADYRGGADDILGLANNRYQSFVGDVRHVSATGKLTGGNDTIFIQSSWAGSEAIGDAVVVEGIAGDLAELTGGNDHISGGPASKANLIGDVFAQRQHSVVRGGADRIAGGNIKEDIVGDVYDIRGGQLIGGNDTIDGGDGADQIFGDVMQSDAQSRVTGGGDIIHGGDNDDYIYGEGLGQGTFTGGNDQLYGDAGSDTIFGQTGNDFVSGGAGADFLYGGVGDDLLTGGTENDKLYGENGNDTLDGAQGADHMEGGAGDDTYFVNDGSDSVAEGAGAGFDTVWTVLNNGFLGANVEHMRFYGTGDFIGIGNGLDNFITGGTGTDALAGRDGSDRLYAGNGDDQLHGEAGADILDGGAGKDRLEGGTGGDTVSYQSATGGVTADLLIQNVNAGDALGDSYLDIESLWGSNFADNLRGDELGNGISGGEGDDVLYGRGGNDTMSGGGGKDRIDGGAGSDRLYGEDGADTVTGGADGDIIYGGAGADLWLGGEAGDDRVLGGLGDDRMDGGAGIDRLYGEDGSDRITGGADGDIIYGGDESAGGDGWLGGDAGADYIAGGAGNDRIDGGADADRLHGETGDDIITGGDGDDWIEGGAGTDRMYGQAGADSFDFNRGSGADLIYDFGNDADTLRIDASYGFANAAAVLAATTASGTNALIDLGGGNSILLVGYLANHTIASLADDIVIG